MTSGIYKFFEGTQASLDSTVLVQGNRAASTEVCRCMSIKRGKSKVYINNSLDAVQPTTAHQNVSHCSYITTF